MSRIGIFTRRDFSLPTEPCVFCAKATRSQIQAHGMAPPAPCCVWCSFEAPADGRMQDFATLIEVEHFDVGFPNGVSCEPAPRDLCPSCGENRAALSRGFIHRTYQTPHGTRCQIERAPR